MSEKKKLTEKKQYLQYILPSLNEKQVDQMISVLTPKKLKYEKKVSEPVVASTPYAELMALIGCDDAKEQLTNMVAAFRMNKIAESRNRKSNKPYFHAVFSGNPGCAKTTCARLYAKVLAYEGVIKKETCTILTRADLCGRYQGETAPKVRNRFQQHAGELILIDEAYSLCDESPFSKNNYGEEAINEIIICLENNPQTVVIFAGYLEKMEEFLASNPGLRSRIPYHIAFKDYTSEQLVAISRKIAEEKGYFIPKNAEQKLYSIFEDERKQVNFGNGRFARNLVEAAIQRKARSLGVMNMEWNNLADPNLYSDEVLFTLDESCFEHSCKVDTEHKYRIGFCN